MQFFCFVRYIFPQSFANIVINGFQAVRFIFQELLNGNIAVLRPHGRVCIIGDKNEAERRRYCQRGDKKEHDKINQHALEKLREFLQIAYADKEVKEQKIENQQDGLHRK